MRADSPGDGIQGNVDIQPGIAVAAIAEGSTAKEQHRTERQILERTAKGKMKTDIKFTAGDGANMRLHQMKTRKKLITNFNNERIPT